LGAAEADAAVSTSMAVAMTTTMGDGWSADVSGG
jgi:hypothetical protein